MELRQLKTFQTVARLLSFTRAAEALDYAQSSVTAQIQTLEAELDVTLFDRLGRRIALTDAGERLLNYADKLLAMADEAALAVTDDPAGKLVISVPETLTTYRLPPLLAKYRARFPRVQMTFQFVLCPMTPQHVAEGNIDVAITLSGPFKETTYIGVQQLIKEPLLLIAPPRHALARRKLVYPHDLKHVAVLLTEMGCSYRALFEQRLMQDGITLTETMEFHSVEAIKQCVMAGIGVAMVPEVAVRREIGQGRLIKLHWCEPDFHVYTQLVWHKQRWQSPALRAFIELARETLQSDAPARDFLPI